MTATNLSPGLHTGNQTTAINGVQLFWECTGDSGRVVHNANARQTDRALVWQMQHWLQRYLPAEFLAGLAAVACVTFADALNNDELLTIAASVVGSTISYYSFILIRELVQARRAYCAAHVRYTRHTAFITIRNLALEFGSAELLDNLLFSPVLLYVCIQTVPNLQIAVVLSEMASSAAFYATVVVAHEIRRALADTAVC